MAVYYSRAALLPTTPPPPLANIHYTCDTRRTLLEGRRIFFDANGPAVANAQVEISRAFLSNPHVDALTEHFGTASARMKNAVLGMDNHVDLPEGVQRIGQPVPAGIGGALVELDGKQLAVPSSAPTKRIWTLPCAVPAIEAEAGYFDAHRAELDELYGKIVKNLKPQAIC